MNQSGIETVSKADRLERVGFRILHLPPLESKLDRVQDRLLSGSTGVKLGYVSNTLLSAKYVIILYVEFLMPLYANW